MRDSLMCPSRGTPFDEFSPLENVEAYEHEDGWWWCHRVGDQFGGPFPTEDAALDAGLATVGAELRAEAEREAEAEAELYRELTRER